MALVVLIKAKDLTKAGLKKAETGVKRFSSRIKSINSSQVLALGGAAFAIDRLATKYANFDTKIREITTLLQDSTEQTVKDLRSEIQTTAIQFGQSLDDMAKAKYDIISAGFTKSADSAILLQKSAQLAVGGVTQINKSADLLTTVLNSYQFSAKKAADVNDILFTTVRLGKTTMDELAGSLGQVTAIAKTANLKLEDLGAAVATLTAGGLQTPLAITAMRSALLSLTAPMSQSKKEMDRLGISIKRMKDGSLDLVKTIAQFRGLPLDVLKKIIPNIRAVNGIAILANNFDKLQDNVNQFALRGGAAAEAFKKIEESAGFKLKQMRVRFATAFQKIGKAVLPLVEAVSKLAELFTNLPDKTQDFIVKIGELTLAIAALNKVLKITAGASLFKLIAKGASALGAVGAAIGGLATVITGGIFILKKQRDTLNKLREQSQQIQQSHRGNIPIGPDFVQQAQGLNRGQINLSTDFIKTALALERSKKATKQWAIFVKDITKNVKGVDIGTRTVADNTTRINSQTIKTVDVTGRLRENWRNMTKLSSEMVFRIESLAFAITNTLTNRALEGLNRKFDQIFGHTQSLFQRMVVNFANALVQMEARLLSSKIFSFFAKSGLGILGPIGIGLGILGSLFQKGGIVNAQTGLQGTDTVPAILTRGEAVIPRPIVEENRPLIDSLVSGGGVSSGNTISNVFNITIQAFNRDGVEDVVRSKSFRQAISDAVNQGEIQLVLNDKFVRALR